MMSLANILFYFTLFIGLVLPSNSNFYFSFFGISIALNELSFLLLPVINLFCRSSKGITIKNFKVKRNIIFLLLFVLFIEVILKNLIFNQSVSESFKAIRIGIPFFSSLVLIVQGIRANIHIVWKTILYAVLCSVILSLVVLVVPLPIYQNVGIGDNILIKNYGRILNSNAAFGLIGLYLLVSKDRSWYNKGRLVKIASVLSVIGLVLTFNRTYLAILILELFYFTRKDFTIKKIVRISFLTSILGVFVMIIYFNNEVVKRSVDKRITSVLVGEKTLQASTIDNNREIIYNGVAKQIYLGHYWIGMPIKDPIFIWPKKWSTDEDKEIRVTDTSFITFLLRYGIISLFISIVILTQLFKVSHNVFYRSIFIFYLIASLNIDSLVRQNSVFFLIIVFIISTLKKQK